MLITCLLNKISKLRKQYSVIKLIEKTGIEYDNSHGEIFELATPSVKNLLLLK